MKITTRLMRRKLDIPNAVAKYAEEHASGYCNFVSYLEKFDDEVLQRIFAFKRPKGKNFLITEVVRKVSGCKQYITKNLYFTQMAGYKAIFTSKQKFIGYYAVYLSEDFDKWFFETNTNYLKTGYKIINPQLLLETKYKYCGYNGEGLLMEYLETYNKYPNLELLSKLEIQPSKTLCRKAMQDKQFCKFLSQNKKLVRIHGSAVTLMAYKNKISFKDASEVMNAKIYIGKNIKEVKGTKIDRLKLQKYLADNKIDYPLYDDYLGAIKYLNLDLNDTKNVFPKDFMRMHDLRINEYASVYAKNNAKERRKLNKQFMKISNKYQILNLSGSYLVSIAKEIKDLIYEGKILHHCVGDKGYDKKMADEKTLIFFVREITNPNIPFVTMEYSLKEKRILQIYADHDQKPSDNVLNFVNNTWLSFAKKMIKKKEKELCLAST